MSFGCGCVAIEWWSPAAKITHTEGCPMAPSPEPARCAGGCGEIARRCCDSVIGHSHQSVCPNSSAAPAVTKNERRFDIAVWIGLLTVGLGLFLLAASEGFIL